MQFIIYFIIAVLYIVLIAWTWNNVKDFSNNISKIKYVVIGIITLFIVTYIIFNISKIGINYPNKEIAKIVRRISVFLFIPINGYISLPHIAKIKTDISDGNVDDEKSKRKIKILVMIMIIVVIIEIIFLKDFQKRYCSYDE